MTGSVSSSNCSSGRTVQNTTPKSPPRARFGSRMQDCEVARFGAVHPAARSRLHWKWLGGCLRQSRRLFGVRKDVGRKSNRCPSAPCRFAPSSLPDIILGSVTRMCRGGGNSRETGTCCSQSFAGRVVEVTPGGGTVWEWIHEPYSNSKGPSVTKASRHELTLNEVASCSCSSVDPSVSSRNEAADAKPSTR